MKRSRIGQLDAAVLELIDELLEVDGLRRGPCSDGR